MTEYKEQMHVERIRQRKQQQREVFCQRFKVDMI